MSCILNHEIVRSWKTSRNVGTTGLFLVVSRKSTRYQQFIKFTGCEETGDYWRKWDLELPFIREREKSYKHVKDNNWSTTKEFMTD